MCFFNASLNHITFDVSDKLGMNVIASPAHSNIVTTLQSAMNSIGSAMNTTISTSMISDQMSEPSSPESTTFDDSDLLNSTCSDDVTAQLAAAGQLQSSRSIIWLDGRLMSYIFFKTITSRCKLKNLNIIFQDLGSSFMDCFHEVLSGLCMTYLNFFMQ